MSFKAFGNGLNKAVKIVIEVGLIQLASHYIPNTFEKNSLHKRFNRCFKEDDKTNIQLPYRFYIIEVSSY